MPNSSLFMNAVNMFFRLSGYHLMSLMVSISILAFIPNIIGGIVTQFVGLGIIIVLPYLTVWKWGDSDCNKIAHNRIKRDSLLGFKVGLIAYSPYMLLGVLLILARIGLLPDSIMSWYRLICSPFLALNQSLMPTTLMLAEQSFGCVIISALILLTVPVSIGIAYYMGINRVSFSESFGFAKHDMSAQYK